jgi:hypothetical protein
MFPLDMAQRTNVRQSRMYGVVVSGYEVGE